MHGSTLSGLDWLMIGLYFSLLLGVAWWVIRKSKDTAADYFLAGRNLSWWLVGASIFASNIGSEHVVGLAGSGVPTAWRWPISSCTRGACWCWRGFSCPSTPARWSSPCPSFWSGGFRPPRATCSRSCRWSRSSFPKSRWAFSPAAWCSARCCRKSICTLGRHLTVEINSFWIGSVLVVVLTGLYTSLGGMRAVAYNDAVQTVILIVGSAILDDLRVGKLGRLDRVAADLGSEMFNLWKPLVPPGVEGDLGAGQGKRPHGLVLQRLFPLAGHALLRADGRLVVLVYGPIHRAAGVGRPDQQTARRGSIFAGILKLLPIYLFIVPGLVCFALAKSGKVPELTARLFPGGRPGSANRPRPHSR